MGFSTGFCKSYCCLFKEVYDAENTGYCCQLKRAAFEILTTLIDLTESYHWMNKDVGDNSIPKEFITALSDIIDSTGVCILEYLRNTKEMCFPCTITRYQLVNNFEQLIFYERLIF